ncbi:hypothetical protein ABT47_16150 [Shewanella xiamenensis]|nr:hypothetical protein ABT47_16150 [Shewanella xiamenensis]
MIEHYPQKDRPIPLHAQKGNKETLYPPKCSTPSYQTRPWLECVSNLYRLQQGHAAACAAKQARINRVLEVTYAAK